MTHLNPDDLATVLRQVAPEPDGLADRAGSARRRARRMRRRRRVLVAGAAVVVALAVAVPSLLVDAGTRAPAGPAGTRTCADDSCELATVLASITRPLRLPSLEAGASCPVSPTRRLPAGAGFSRPFSARGEAPFYLSTSAPVPVGSMRTTGDRGRWRDQKVIWAVDGSYAGPLLVRGGRIDRPGPLRFLRYIGAYGYAGDAGDDRPSRSLLYNWYDLEATPDGAMSSFPSGIFVRAAGCYAIQVDGTDFSEHLVFRVVDG
jgi:hypothetical protein